MKKKAATRKKGYPLRYQYVLAIALALAAISLASVLLTSWRGITGASVSSSVDFTGPNCGSSYSGDGDWEVSTAVTCAHEVINVSGSINIIAGGNLSLINTTLNMTVNASYINVTVNGGLWAINNSRFTSNASGSAAYGWYFVIYNGTNVYLENSTIEDIGFDDGNTVNFAWTEGVYVNASCSGGTILSGVTVTGGHDGLISAARNCTFAHSTYTSQAEFGIVSAPGAANNLYLNNSVTFGVEEVYAIPITGSNETVRRNTITLIAASTGIGIISGDNNVVENNTVRGQPPGTGNGIDVVDGASVGFTQTTLPRVTGNTLNMTGSGVRVDMSSTGSVVTNANISENTIIHMAGDGIRLTNAHNNTLTDNTITNASYGVQIVSSNITSIIRGNISFSRQHSIQISGNSTNITVTDTILRVYEYNSTSGDINFDTNSGLSNATLINVSFNRSSVRFPGDGEPMPYVFVWWYLDVNVTDTSGAPISGASVNITDVNNNIDFDGTTAASGAIARQTLREYFQNRTDFTYDTNYTVSANKSAYAINSTSINLTSSTSTTLQLANSCGEVTDTTTLRHNVTSAGTCFTLTADNIVIDCNNNYILYGTSAAGFGINATDRTNITVRGCRVYQSGSSALSYAFHLNNTNSSMIRDNVINTSGNTARAFNLESSNYNQFINNTFNRTVEAIAKTTVGIYSIDSHFNNITNNTITTNNSQSIILGILNNNNNILRGNSLTSLSSISIDIQRGINNTIIENTITTGNNGIRLMNYPNGTSITSTRVTSTGGSTGINTDSCSYCTLLHNIVTSEGNGIDISDTSNVGIAHNTLINNTVNSTSDGTAGIYITGSHSRVINNTAVGWAGFDVEFGTNITLTGNTGTSNNIGTDNAGLYVLGLTNSTFTDNIFIALSVVGVGIWFADTNSNLTFVNNTIQAGATWFLTAADDRNITFENTWFNSSEGNVLIVPQFVVPVSTTVNLSTFNISGDRTFINTTLFPFLNVSLDVILTNVTFRYAEVKYDSGGGWVDCPASICTFISYANDEYRFNVTYPVVYLVNLTDNAVSGNLTTLTASGVGSVNMTIAGNTNLSMEYHNNQTITLYDGTTPLMNLTADFSQGVFNLSRVSITVASNSVIVNISGQLHTGHRKTLFIADNSFVSLCAKDTEVAAVSDVSSGCTGTNETDLTSCLGNSTGYIAGNLTCTDLGTTIKVENLTHSAVRGTVAASAEESSSSTTSSGGAGKSTCFRRWSCGEWGECQPDGMRYRTCTDLSKCVERGAVVLTDSQPAENESCAYAGLPAASSPASDHLSDPSQRPPSVQQPAAATPGLTDTDESAGSIPLWHIAAAIGGLALLALLVELILRRSARARRRRNT